MSDQLIEFVMLCALAVTAAAAVTFPKTGPVALVRDHALRPVLRLSGRLQLDHVLDCPFCLTVWTSVACAAAASHTGFAGALAWWTPAVAPALVWFRIQGKPRSGGCGGGGKPKAPTESPIEEFERLRRGREYIAQREAEIRKHYEQRGIPVPDAIARRTTTEGDS